MNNLRSVSTQNNFKNGYTEESFVCHHDVCFALVILLQKKPF